MNKILKNKFKIVTASMLTVMTVCFAQVGVTAKTNCRIYGQDRLETSVKISERGWKNGSDVVVIAQGYEFADALCAAPLAKKYNAPILLTSKEGLSNKIVSEIKRLGVKKAFIIGGPKIVSNKVNDQLKTVNVGEIQRLYGATRYETSLEIAKQMGDSKEVFITSGNGYGDSLSVASIAGKKGAPIVFSNKNDIKDSVKNYVKGKKIYVIGGEGVISNSAVKDLNNFERIWGIDRFETNKSVVEKFKDNINFADVYLVKGDGPRGDEFADALSTSALAATKGAPVILTYNGIKPSLESTVKTNLTSLSSVFAIGGESNVSSNLIHKFDLNFNTTQIDKDNIIYGEKDNVKTIHGDLNVSSNRVKLRNLIVDGVIFVDPGSKGSMDMENVQAKSVVVKSGDKDSIHFSNCKIRNLLIDSYSEVRVVLNENSEINNTWTNTSCILENKKGNFGDVYLQKEDISKNVDVELKGNFNKTLEIVSDIDVTLDGEFNKIAVVRDAKVHINDNSLVKKINANSKCNIKVSDKANVSNLIKAAKNVLVEGNIDNVTSSDNESSTNNGNSSSEDVKCNPKEDEVCILVLKDNNSVLINKNVKFQEQKSALDYLKEVTNVSEDKGFIKSIQGLKNISYDSLSDSYKKKGILGIDWFIYVNGKKSSVGVKSIKPKKKDVVKFVYSQWNWKDFVDEDQKDKMPIDIEKVPESININKEFTIKATCVCRPVYKAIVKVDGKNVATTDVNGLASIKIKSTGKHVVSVEKDGGLDKATIQVKNTSGGSSSSSSTGDEDEGFKQIGTVQGKVNLKIFKNEENKLRLQFEGEASEYVTVTIYNKNHSLSYIGQDSMKSGKCTLNTSLDKGEYEVFYKSLGELKNISIKF